MIVKKISFRFKRLSDSAEVIVSVVLKTCPYSANDPNCKDFFAESIIDKFNVDSITRDKISCLQPGTVPTGSCIHLCTGKLQYMY